METPDGFSRALWKQLGDSAGWASRFPRSRAARDSGWVDLVVVLEEMARTLLSVAVPSRRTIAAAALREAGSDAQQARWLPSLAERLVHRIARVPRAERSMGRRRRRASPLGRRARAWCCRPRRCRFSTPPSADLFVVAFRSEQRDIARGG